MQNTLNQDEIK